MALIAKVAVSAAVVSIDKAYDYKVPEPWQGQVERGRRVMVPFGKGNHLTEGFVLDVVRQEPPARLKPLAHVFDGTVALDEEAMHLANVIRQRYFCTFFEAASLWIPPGVWSQKTHYRLAPGLSPEEAAARCGDDWDAQAICQWVAGKEGPVEEESLRRSFPAALVKQKCKALLEAGVLEKTVAFEDGIRPQTIRILRLACPLEQAVSSLRRGRGYEARLQVLQCIAGYDGIPEKEVCYLTGASPASVRTLVRRGLVECTEQQVYRRVPVDVQPAGPIRLEGEQQQAYDRLHALQNTAPAVALLQGVTGSGKTEVYIRLIQGVLEQGKGAILLVPEIALTPQMLRRFCSHFQDQVAVFHSALTPAQRYDEYRRVREGKARVVLGTRSAVFAPLPSIGLIVMDEEQEWTYKSETAPRYHTREIAKYRCVHHGALLVLGSATPAVESRYLAEKGTYHLVEMTKRYQNTPLPRVVVADMRQHLKDGEIDVIGKELEAELEANLAQGEQSVLFLNRRGNSRLLTCVACGYTPQCENCSVALTYHSKNNRLMCHHCGYSQPVPAACPQCGAEELRLVGCGTQKVQQELERKFPGVGVIRMDADTTVQRTSHEALLEQFAMGKAQILLGTQMIAKGLDFENVTLVGVLDADLSLYSGDFRAGERTFSLLTQVVGRAGRRTKEGRAVIQTYTPGHPIIQAAAAQDYGAFYRYEIEVRQALLAPPFADVASFLASSPVQEKAYQAAARLAATLQQCFEGPYRDCKAPVLGPAPAAIQMMNKKYRYQVSFRTKDTTRIRQLIMDVLRAFYADRSNRMVSLAADINPYSL